MHVIYVQFYVCMQLRMHVCMHACTHVCMYECIYPGTKATFKLDLDALTLTYCFNSTQRKVLLRAITTPKLVVVAVSNGGRIPSSSSSSMPNIIRVIYEWQYAVDKIHRNQHFDCHTLSITLITRVVIIIIKKIKFKI